MLMTPSKGSMQQLLSICEEYCEEFCLSFNVKKSKVLEFGDIRGKTIDTLFLNNMPVETVSEWTYF